MRMPPSSQTCKTWLLFGGVVWAGLGGVVLWRKHVTGVGIKVSKLQGIPSFSLYFQFKM